MSKESVDIMKHFGPETPAHLNQYCCALEDALIEQCNAHAAFREKCLMLADEVMRLRELIPDELNDSK